MKQLTPVELLFIIAKNKFVPPDDFDMQTFGASKSALICNHKKYVLVLDDDRIDVHYLKKEDVVSYQLIQKDAGT